MGLGERIWQWFRSLPFVQAIWGILSGIAGGPLTGRAIEDHWIKVGRAVSEIWRMEGDYPAINSCQDLRAFIAKYPGYSPEAIYLQAKRLGCTDIIEDYAKQITPSIAGESTSEKVANFVRGVGADPTLREALETIGAAVYDTVIGLALPPTDQPDEAVLESVRRFMGTVTTISGIPQLLSMASELLSLGQIDKLGDSIQNIYYNLGLGFVTWQMTSPLIDGGIGQALRRYAAKVYRPERFSLNQVQELKAIGLMSSDELRSYLQGLGWRDRDIDYVIALSYKQLSYSQVMAMWAKGILTEDDVVAELRRLGYTPTDIQRLIQLERPEMDDDTPKIYLSTLDRAYKKHYINEAQYRSYASELRLDPREIDLRLAILNNQEEESTKDLSIGSIKSAFMANVISESEVIHYLSELNLSIDNITLLLNTWREEKAPKVEKINRTTVTAAYSAGVIDRERARSLLESVGISSEAITLMLDTIDAQRSVLTKTPAISALIQALQRDIITRDDFAEALRSQGYPESTIALYTSLALYQPVARSKGLTKAEILEAYSKGLVDKPTAMIYLQSLGYDIPTTELLLAMESKAAIGTTDLQLSKSSILTATYYDTITPEQATELLAKLDYGYDGAEYLVSLTEANQAKQVAAPGLGAVIGALRQGMLDFDTFARVLAHNGLDDVQIAKVYAIAMYNPPKTTNRLTKADALSMYSRGIWSKAETLAYLVQLGYEGDDADYILATVTGA